MIAQSQTVFETDIEIRREQIREGGDSEARRVFRIRRSACTRYRSLIYRIILIISKRVVELTDELTSDM